MLTRPKALLFHRWIEAKPRHLPEAIAALAVHLTEDEIHALEEHYTPHGPSWF